MILMRNFMSNYNHHKLIANIINLAAFLALSVLRVCLRWLSNFQWNQMRNNEHDIFQYKALLIAFSLAYRCML